MPADRFQSYFRPQQIDRPPGRIFRFSCRFLIAPPLSGTGCAVVAGPLSRNTRPRKLLSESRLYGIRIVHSILRYFCGPTKCCYELPRSPPDCKKGARCRLSTQRMSRKRSLRMPPRTATCNRPVNIDLLQRNPPCLIRKTQNVYPEGFDPPELDEERLSYLNQEIVGSRELLEAEQDWPSYERAALKYNIIVYEDDRSELVAKYNREVRVRLNRLEDHRKLDEKERVELEQLRRMFASAKSTPERDKSRAAARRPKYRKRTRPSTRKHSRAEKGLFTAAQIRFLIRCLGQRLP